MEKAIVVLILKPGKIPMNPNSYQPIALSITMCKLMEKIINYRLRWFLESKQLIFKFESGFRLSHSTYDHLINLKSIIREGFAKKQRVIAICLDIEKAYDIVWRILEILLNYGLKENILYFVSNFLSIRIIEVRADLTASLFLIANQVMGLLFADDLTLVCKGKDPHTTHIIHQDCLEEL